MKLPLFLLPVLASLLSTPARADADVTPCRIEKVADCGYGFGKPSCGFFGPRYVQVYMFTYKGRSGHVMSSPSYTPDEKGRKECESFRRLMGGE